MLTRIVVSRSCEVVDGREAVFLMSRERLGSLESSFGNLRMILGTVRVMRGTPLIRYTTAKTHNHKR